MKIATKEEFLELVIEYSAIGTDAFTEEMTDKQREAIVCAHRDFAHAEEKYGDKESDDYCEEAKTAAVGWLKDFNDSSESFYMHVDTGSVDTYENWVSTIDEDELTKGQTREEKMNDYIRDNTFVEVVKGASGWIDADKAVTVNGEIYNIDDIAIYMDNDIREKLHAELAPCEPQKFVDRYAEEHKEKFGETFAIN